MSALAVHGVVAAVVVVAGATLALIRVVRASDGAVLLIAGQRQWRVVRARGLIIRPFLRAIAIATTPIDVELRRVGSQALLSRDRRSLDVVARMRVRINDYDDDVVMVARTMGAQAAGDAAAVATLFAPMLADALGIVAATLDAAQFREQLDLVGQQAEEIIGRDLNGFVLEAVTVELATPDSVHSAGPFR